MSSVKKQMEKREGKIRVTIDLAQADESMNEMTTVERGAFGCDLDGAYTMYYQSRTDLVEFSDVVKLGKDERGIDVVRLCNLQWIDNNKTGVGFIMIDGKKYDFVLKENKNNDVL